MQKVNIANFKKHGKEDKWEELVLSKSATDLKE